MTLQSTLLGLAIALIIALVAALVGPLLIDWNGYRALFEAEARRLTGIDVRIQGTISAQLLPSPRLTFHDITIGTGKDAVRARALKFELALGPLTRGALHAEEVNVDAPEIALSFDPYGRVRTIDISLALDADRFSIKRLRIENGKINIRHEAANTRSTLDDISFDGQAGSLLGPFSGEGKVTFGGVRYPYRIATGRYGADRATNLRLELNRDTQPLNLQINGVVVLADAGPRFDGNFLLTQPVNILKSQKGLTEPWRVSGKIKAMAQSASIENIELLYGSQERALRFTGAADFRFDKQLHINASLSNSQIDLDRLLGDERNGMLWALFSPLAELAGTAVSANVLMKLELSADQVTLNGGALRNVQGNFNWDAHEWRVERFEFQAPGFARVRLNGQLILQDGPARFIGPTEVEAGDTKLFIAWLEGKRNVAPGAPQAAAFRGHVSLNKNEVSIEGGSIEFARQIVTGRARLLARKDQPAHLDAALDVNEIDLDAMLAFGRVVFSSSTFDWPRNIAITADIARAHIGGVTAQKSSIRLKADSGGLHIDRFSVVDFAGASFSAKGHVVATPSSLQGDMHADLEAQSPIPIITLLERFFPEIASVVEQRALTISPVKARAKIVIEGAAQASTGKFNIDGTFGESRLNADGSIPINPVTLETGDVQLTGQIRTDSRQLMTALGLDRLITGDSGPASFTFSADGLLRGPLRFNGQFFAAGVEARYASRISYANQHLTLGDIKVQHRATNLHGQVGFSMTQPRRLHGEITLDGVDGIDLISAILNSTWPHDDYVGEIGLKVNEINLSSQLLARKVSTTVHINKNGISLDDIAGDFAGGTFVGSLSVTDSEDSPRIYTKFSLTGAELGRVRVKDAQFPITGAVSIDAELESTGTNPYALISSLRGSGKIALSNANINGLNPHVFDEVVQVADDPIADPAHIADVVNKVLPNGQLPVPYAEGMFTADAGQIRFHRIDARGHGADLSFSAALNLTEGVFDAHLLLSGSQRAAGTRPGIYIDLKGPLISPSREIDVSALSAWLALRSVEEQTKKMQSVEFQSDVPGREPILQGPPLFPPLWPPLMMPAAPDAAGATR